MPKIATTAPKLTSHHITLPLTTLHYIQCGSGPDLIVVPATFSQAKEWSGLIQFLGQRFTTYFFELPGHGQSTPFTKPYTSAQVAQTVQDFMNAKQIKTASIFGFSFGGILTLTILKQLSKRVDKVILFSPAVAYHAINYSKTRLKIVSKLINLLSRPKAQQWILNHLCHNPIFVNASMTLIQKIGKIDRNKDEVFRQKLLTLQLSTLNVLLYQINEIFTFDLSKQPMQFPHRFFFGMSIHDPLLNYHRTRTILKTKFPKWEEHQFNFPYHQPPQPFTYQFLNQQFSPLLKMISK